MGLRYCFLNLVIVRWFHRPRLAEVCADGTKQEGLSSKAAARPPHSKLGGDVGAYGYGL